MNHSRTRSTFWDLGTVQTMLKHLKGMIRNKLTMARPLIDINTILVCRLYRVRCYYGFLPFYYVIFPCFCVWFVFSDWSLNSAWKLVVPSEKLLKRVSLKLSKLLSVHPFFDRRIMKKCLISQKLMEYSTVVI